MCLKRIHSICVVYSKLDNSLFVLNIPRNSQFPDLSVSERSESRHPSVVINLFISRDAWAVSPCLISLSVK